MPCPATAVPRSAHRAWAAALLLVAAVLVFGPASASAAPGCTVTTGGGLLFGVYDPFLGTPLDSQMTLRIRCPKTVAPRVLLSAGSAGVFDPRTLRNGSEILKYNVFLNAARTVIWGDGSGVTRSWQGPRGRSTLDAFGRIPAGQDPAIGNYADSLTVTILF